jgi:flagellar basal-body rod protein FlgF
VKNIWVPLSGQIAQQRKVETIANNVANANTVGFKKDQLVFKEHLTALTKGLEDIDIPHNEFSPADFYHTQGGENAFVDVKASYTNFEQGTLVPTNNPLDFGIKGEGFVEILTPQGVRFTRRGNFSLSRDGELVTDQGFKVLRATTTPAQDLTGRDLASIPIEDPSSRTITIPTSHKLNISLDGEISTSQGSAGKISVVEFKDRQALRKEGQGLFVNSDELNLIRTEVKSTINQGFVEGSNVNAIEEMSELIKAHRHFDSIQKAINAYDSITGKAVNDVPRF